MKFYRCLVTDGALLCQKTRMARDMYTIWYNQSWLAFQILKWLIMWKIRHSVWIQLNVYFTSFLDDPVKDHRDVTLAAVKQRFSEDLFLGVGKMEIMDHTTLRTMLCVEEDDEVDVEDELNNVSRATDTPASSQDGLDAFLLMSPSRKSRGKRYLWQWDALTIFFPFFF